MLQKNNFENACSFENQKRVLVLKRNIKQRARFEIKKMRVRFQSR